MLLYCTVVIYCSAISLQYQVQASKLTNTEIPDHGRGQVRGGTGNHHTTTTHGYRKCAPYATNTPASARAPPHPGSDLVWSSPDATMAVILFCTLNLVLLSTHFWRRKGDPGIQIGALSDCTEGVAYIAVLRTVQYCTVQYCTV